MPKYGNINGATRLTIKGEDTVAFYFSPELRYFEDFHILGIDFFLF